MLFAATPYSLFSLQLIRLPFLLSNLPQTILLTHQVSLLPGIKHAQPLCNTDCKLESKPCHCSF